MRASSVGEYLIMFGALIAVVATAVISLGRLIVFQAQTAEEKYSQSIADEIASVVSEVSASPDGAYYVLEPTRTKYNITVTETRVVLEKNDEQVIATHVGRGVIPTRFNSTDTLCIQKSLGKILIKTGECLSCNSEDGFCDAGCDALGKCDSDCIISGDGYCSKSCAAIADKRCDIDCVGKFDGIWDPDCGCQISEPSSPSPRGLCPSGPCSSNQMCDLDSGVLDFAWDPCCTGKDGVCDPDCDQGCDPDCVSDTVCRGTCISDPSICFSACNNPACQACKSWCAPGCSSRPTGWHSNLTCRGELPDFIQNTTYPIFLKINHALLQTNCSINATQFQMYALDKEVPVGEFFEDSNSYLVYTPKPTGVYAYFGGGNLQTHLITELMAVGGTVVNEFIKVKVEDGAITQASELQNNTSISGKWGYYENEEEVNQTITSSNITVAEILIKSESWYKRYQIFLGLPAVRLTSNYGTPCFWDFPLGYTVSTDGTFGYISGGPTPMMLYCNGAQVLAHEIARKLSCTSRESWLFLCSNCQPLKDWILYNPEVEVKQLLKLEDMPGYSPYC